MRGLARNRPGGFSISVFGRFAYTLSALNGHYLGGFFRGFWFLGNVRSYQTACARTAGHLISEKRAAPFCDLPWFLGVGGVVL